MATLHIPPCMPHPACPALHAHPACPTLRARPAAQFIDDEKNTDRQRQMTNRDPETLFKRMLPVLEKEGDLVAEKEGKRPSLRRAVTDIASARPAALFKLRSSSALNDMDDAASPAPGGRMSLPGPKRTSFAAIAKLTKLNAKLGGTGPPSFQGVAP